jgi:hypothetical protein
MKFLADDMVTEAMTDVGTSNGLDGEEQEEDLVRDEKETR